MNWLITFICMSSSSGASLLSSLLFPSLPPHITLGNLLNPLSCVFLYCKMGIIIIIPPLKVILRKYWDNPHKEHIAHCICSINISYHNHNLEECGRFIFYLVQQPSGNLINLVLQIILHSYISSSFHDQKQLNSDWFEGLNTFMFKNVLHVQASMISK